MIYPKLIAAPAMLLIVLLFSTCTPMAFLSDTEQSNFIFRGTITDTGEQLPNTTGLPGKLALARVEEVYDAPPLLQKFQGREVRVVIPDDASLPAGAERIFFTSSLQAGQTLTVNAVKIYSPDEVKNPREKVRESRQAVLDQMRIQHLRARSLVVVGTVKEVLPGPAPAQFFISEHDPQWKKAVLTVESVLKGDKNTETVEYLFASSRDVAWRDAPKFEAGQNGIFLLHFGEEQQAYLATDPKDFYPSVDMVNDFRRLIRKSKN